MNTVRADLLRYCEPGQRYQQTRLCWRSVAVALLNEQGLWAVLEYRFRQWAHVFGFPLNIPLRAISFITRKIVEIVTGISLDSSSRFGPGLYIGHFGAIIVGGQVVAGDNCSLHQGVTLGYHNGGSPTIGDWVFFAPGSKAIGPITIGNDVRVGANAVVHKDVPSCATAVGVPARVVIRLAQTDLS